jgi:hypothetical protein
MVSDGAARGERMVMVGILPPGTSRGDPLAISRELGAHRPVVFVDAGDPGDRGANATGAAACLVTRGACSARSKRHP